MSPTELPTRHTRPRGATVLIVEDDRATAAFLQDLLESVGIIARAAFDGEEARRWLETRTPDAIVLDVMLPKLDGISILRWLRTRPETKQTPVLIVTALADDTATWRAWQAGCDSYLTKPFDPDQLLCLLERLGVP